MCLSIRYETPDEILARCKGAREKDLVLRRDALATDFAALLATTASVHLVTGANNLLV